MDGNKRTAYVVMRLFMVLNGWELVVRMPERYTTMLDLAAGHLAEPELADWLRANIRPERMSEPGAEYS